MGSKEPFIFPLKKMVKQKNYPWWWLVLAGAFLLLVIFLQPDKLISEDQETSALSTWQDNYQEMARESGVSTSYSSGLVDYESNIANTPYYDYDNRLISKVANDIAMQSTSSLEAITRTLDYVYRKTSYVYGEPDNNCLEGTAPEILNSGSGQCDTQSIVVISILRKMGIAAKPVGGCVYQKPNTLLQSFLLNSFTSLRTPSVEPTLIEDGEVTLGRGMAPGGLHAWVVAWVPGEGWVALESTSGQLANVDLYNYHVELFPADDSKQDICMSVNMDYARACHDRDLSSLNAEGLGLMQEVIVS